MKKVTKAQLLNEIQEKQEIIKNRKEEIEDLSNVRDRLLRRSDELSKHNRCLTRQLEIANNRNSALQFALTLAEQYAIQLRKIIDGETNQQLMPRDTEERDHQAMKREVSLAS